MRISWSTLVGGGLIVFLAIGLTTTGSRADDEPVDKAALERAIRQEVEKHVADELLKEAKVRREVELQQEAAARK